MMRNILCVGSSLRITPIYNFTKCIHRTSDNLEKYKSDEKNIDKNTKSEESLPTKTLDMGVTIKDLKFGNGSIAKSGKLINVFYTGYFKDSKKVFDSSTKGNGFKFNLGRGEVIKGWDIGVPGMKVGGKRVVTCPPNTAYGSAGVPPTIPPNSTLVFEIELKDVS